MKDVRPTTCYFTRDERRQIERIADATERPQSKVVQFAVRTFVHLFEQDPVKALELAQRIAGSN